MDVLCEATASGKRKYQYSRQYDRDWDVPDTRTMQSDAIRLKFDRPDARDSRRSPTAGNTIGITTSFPVHYRGSSFIRNCALLGPYSRIMPRALWWPYGGGQFLVSEVPLYPKNITKVSLQWLVRLCASQHSGVGIQSSVCRVPGSVFKSSRVQEFKGSAFRIQHT